jgi:pimeloyl-ACP methyl ester carboxylesterase
MRPAMVLLFAILLIPPGEARPGWGSTRSAKATPAAVEEASPPGTVFIIGGVGGCDLLPHSARFAFPRAGLPHEVRDFVWTHGPLQHLKDLQDHRHVEQKADELAGEILRLRAADSARPIYLVARSGGAGLALRAAERLPPGSLARIVLLAAAVSPHYDLVPALRATRGEIVSFHSPFDKIVLDWGTRQFGTIDRHYSPSAGFKGFLRPTHLEDDELALYGRLVQIPWQPRMLWAGYFGGHESTGLPCFLIAEVVPWLR